MEKGETVEIDASTMLVLAKNRIAELEAEVARLTGEREEAAYKLELSIDALRTAREALGRDDKPFLCDGIRALKHERDNWRSNCDALMQDAERQREALAEQREEIARLTEERREKETTIGALRDRGDEYREERDLQREDIRRLMELVECQFDIKPCSVALKDYRGSWCRNCHTVADLKENYPKEDE